MVLLLTVVWHLVLTSIRDVIAFPKTKTAECPLTQAPAPVEANQLRDLGIRLREKPKTQESK